LLSYERMNEPTAAPTQSGEATRADLLAAGRKLFASKGFDGTSVRALTSEAGTNLGAVTYHFGSKRGLYTAVLEDGVRPLAARVKEAARGSGTARERMLAVVEAYFDHLTEHPELPHLMLQELAAGKEPPAVVVEIIQSVKDTIAQLQLEGVADGSVRPGHPVFTALSVVSQPIYLTLVSPLLRKVGGIDLAEPEVRRTAVDHMLAFVDAALRPRGGGLCGHAAGPGQPRTPEEERAP
jgi:TetR/AcrR family transcriptional regulator